MFEYSPASIQVITMFNVEKAVNTLIGLAFASPQSKCALHIRLALDAGGVEIRPTIGQAKLFNPALERYGFEKIRLSKGVLIDNQNCRLYKPELGDIAVIPNVPGGRSEGHIAMFTGEFWYSDFKQIDMWGGPWYRQVAPDVAIFKYAGEPS